jgi:hypothetical protein
LSRLGRWYKISQTQRACWKRSTRSHSGMRETGSLTRQTQSWRRHLKSSKPSDSWSRVTHFKPRILQRSASATNWQLSCACGSLSGRRQAGTTRRPSR